MEGFIVRKFRRNGICQLLSFLAAMMFVVSSTPVTVFAQESASSDAVQSMALSKNKPVMYIAAAQKKTKSTAGSGA